MLLDRPELHPTHHHAPPGSPDTIIGVRHAGKDRQSLT